MSSRLIDEGSAALREGDTAAARRAFEAALADVETGEALEGLAEALYFEHEYPAAARHYERSYAAYRKRRDRFRAGRAARAVAWITGNVLGDWAVSGGWLLRARSMLAELGDDRPERGWVLVFTAFSEPDAGIRESLLREAISVGCRFHDPDLEFLARAYLGGVYVLTDRVEEEMALSDEAMAALCAGELTDPITLDEILCGLLWACELVNDVPRAEQWMGTARQRMARSNVVAAFCRAHYGGILTAAGRWPEAEVELVASARHFDEGRSPRRAAALIRLADLRVRQGRIEEAAELLKGLDQHPDAVTVLSALHLARGQTALAREVLERRLGGPDDEVATVGESIMSGPLLALLVEIYLAEKRVDDAWRLADRLTRVADAQRGAFLKGTAALARGRVRVASGQDARACLHDALQHFARARLPLDLARARLEMAYALADSSPEVAVAEAAAALEEFERLPAARDADAAGALLRSLGAPIRTGPKRIGTLTRREAEILELIRVGLSNKEIGERLYISRKTVEHHVGSVLAKLGLRNRAEAAAYATRERISP